MRFFRSLMLAVLISSAIFTKSAAADSLSDNPIVFVTAVPNPTDFGTFAATFGNHLGRPTTAFRGGDLWIRYPDGSLKNLTSAAGYGNSGFQGAGSIAVRDPAVHWDGAKIVFSMIIGNPTQQYQLTSHHWQLYEISGLGPADTPVITKVANQPANYNNIAPVYAGDDTIIFVSDRPRDDTVLHTYPQRDEYESSATNTGIWKLDPSSANLVLLDHAPSGDFNPIIDSFGRVIFTRWDHLQRDQQNVGVSFGAFNYASETGATATGDSGEIFPEPRSVNDPDYRANINLFTINQFFPWMMNQDGTDLETLNHVGRHEIGNYIERSFNDDSNVKEFYGQYQTGANQNEFSIFLHTKESPLTAGTYFGTNCQEFGTHSAGQIMTITGAPGLNPDDMIVSHVTHPDTSGASDSPSSEHSGLYRDPLPLSNGKVLAAHTSQTRTDSNIGSSSSPLSRYAFRIKVLTQSGSYYAAGQPLTSGITKNVSFWSPDNLISYNGALWELMPVEVRQRARPAASSLEVPAIEAQVIASMGVSLEELRQYLRDNNLALVVSRNVTTRDRNDKQQPVNLRVPSGVSSTPLPGKVYDVSHLEFFQGDLIRGYGSGMTGGRRVLPRRMHSVAQGVNLPAPGAAVGAVQIAEDGSMAAFVPARRALSWQLVDPQGEAVVRERYWVTFQPGEIRVCASCHGVNTSDQLGNPPPDNSPFALAQLIAHWKDLPPPTPSPDGPGGGNDGGGADYSLRVRGKPRLGPRSRFNLMIKGGRSGESLVVRTKVNRKLCPETAALALDARDAGMMKGRFPDGRYRVRFSLFRSGSGSGEELASAAARIRGRKLRRAKPAALCSKLNLRSR